MAIKLKSFKELAAHRDKFAAPGEQKTVGLSKSGQKPQEDKQKDKEKILVTHHAVERLLDERRTGDFSFGDAEETLIRAVREGHPVGRRPGGTVEYRFNGLFILVKKTRDGALAVLTVNGDQTWRHWHRKTHVLPKYGPKARAAL